ncbi:MAG: hypothetical protein M3Y87_03190 [Myxococcota bacterium]|nr:hypothetical protein [Myxococcota bacterium]
MNTTRWTAFAAALATSVLAAGAQAQGMGGEELAGNDWMTSGLAPLVLLLGLGILVALVAAAIAAVTLGTSRRRFRGPREA